PGPGAALGRDLALEHQAPVVALHAELGERGRHAADGRGIELEGAFDDGAGGAGPDHLGRRALAEQQRQRVHEQRLAGPRLAGEHVEAGRERQRDVGDDGEIADPQLGEHYSRSRSERSPHWSFLRMRAKKPSGPRRTSSTGRSARRTSSRSPGCMVVPTCPSNETSTSSVHGGIGSTATCACDETTSGRTARVWGQMAVTTMASTPVTTMGPPAESE